MKKIILLTLLAAFSFKARSQENEVFYHVFQRSFFDSDGDSQGDLQGINDKLDYLQRLGVTSILLTPLYRSGFYHNYFASDFEKIDPEYGEMKHYRYLVKEVHKRKMKLYQDVEMQYVAGNHLWFTDSYKNPKSQYTDYIYYLDKENLKPWYFYNTPEFTLYDGTKAQIAVVNMKSAKVKAYTLKMLAFWTDPNGDGDFSDGVDGFRLDHMMDDLDNAGRLTNLFKNFWTPLLTDLKKVNPELKIIAEQADWVSYGNDYYTKANVDRVFAFPLKFAITSFDKEKIAQAADSTFNYLPEGKVPIVFIENHDTKRFASEESMTPEKLKAGAALNLLLGGIPSLYYGQELGMQGVALKGTTDGNDIPLREAFEWYAGGEGKGMAYWYKGTGDWWDKQNTKPNDGISFEEALTDENSLWNYYQELIHLRRRQPALAYGNYAAIHNSNENVLSFIRTYKKAKALVVINLSSEAEMVFIDDPSLRLNRLRLQLLSGNKEVDFKRGGKSLELPPYAVQVWSFY